MGMWKYLFMDFGGVFFILKKKKELDDLNLEL